jgi:hypothetical protein
VWERQCYTQSERTKGGCNMDWVTIKQLWPDIKDFLQSAAIIFSAVTLGIAVWRLPTIVNDLTQAGNDINDKLQKTLKNINELQRIAADEPVSEEITPSNTPARSTGNRGDSENWEKIKQCWAEVRNYIEQIVGGIKDGRVARRYDGIARYSYADVIRSLADDEFITPAQAETMTQMNNRFLSMRKRSKHVTSDVVQQFEKWRNSLLVGN